MLKRKVGMYWKVCWGFFAPVTMIAILAYTLATAEVLKYHGYVYPISATGEFSLTYYRSHPTLPS